MLLIAHSAVANSPQSTHVSRLLANLEPLASECEIVAAYGVAKRMLCIVQLGARPFFAMTGPIISHHVRMGAMHYLKAGTPVSQRFVMQCWLR